jgi:hypothetical protein
VEVWYLDLLELPYHRSYRLVIYYTAEYYGFEKQKPCKWALHMDVEQGIKDKQIKQAEAFHFKSAFTVLCPAVKWFTKRFYFTPDFLLAYRRTPRR